MNIYTPEELAVSVTRLPPAIDAVSAARRLREVHLHVDSGVHTRSLYAAIAYARTVGGALPVAALVGRGGIPFGGPSAWFFESCLLLVALQLLKRGRVTSAVRTLLIIGALIVSAGAELIERTANWSETPLMLSTPCILWMFGLTLLGLWSDRFLPSVPYECIAAQRKLPRLVPLTFVIPVVAVVIVGALELWSFFHLDSKQIIVAAVVCAGIAGIVFLLGACLSQSEEAFRNLLELSNDAIVVVDPRSRRIRARNRKVGEVVGIADGHLESRSLEELFHFIPIEQFQELIAILGHCSTPKATEIHWNDLNHKEHWLEVTARYVQFRGSSAVMLHARDVSERKHLEHRKSQAEKAQSLNRLATGITHDFNNLLQGMRMCSDLLSETKERSESEELLKQIDWSIASAQQLTGWLLSYAQQRKISPKKTDLNTLLLEMRCVLKTMLGPNIKFSAELSDNVGAVWIDPAQFHEIIINLAINARDAMPTGGTLRIQTRALVLNSQTRTAAPPGRYLALSIIDSGIGMDEATALRAFEPFFTTKDRDCGTGLGLSVVDGIVRQSGGFVRLESSIGKGTAVEILLPVCDEERIPGSSVLLHTASRAS
jgi:PAS domain S-box-containing protein